MSAWIYGRPAGLVQRALVFIDADNLLITEDCPYTPNHSIATALGWVVAFASEIAEDPGIYAFVDMQRVHPNADRGELAAECERRGITVIHKSSDRHGKDQVDAGIITEWYNQHRNLPLEVPFVLISLDKDFIEMLEETKKDGRPIFVGLPTQQFYPPHVQQYQGFGWLDTQANRHRAMSFLLNEDGSRARPEFEAKFERQFPDYVRWRQAFVAVSRAFHEQPNRVFENTNSVIDFLVTVWQHLGFGPEDATKTLPYLVYYSVLVMHEGSWKQNTGHRLLQPADTTASA